MSVLRLEGLPYRATSDDVSDFFHDLADVKPDKIHLLLNRDHRPSGTGYAEFSSDSDARSAQDKCDGKCIGDSGRYVRIVRPSGEGGGDELGWHLRRQRLIMRDGDEDGERFCVRMYGLPFRVSEYEVAKWFGPSGAECVDVQIHLNHEGRPSGDATAFFETLDQAKLAMERNKEDMAGRYINLSMVSAAATFNSAASSGSRHCVKMSGLPFRATEQEMKDFFLPDADCLAVRVILNRNGRPSGDAIAEFADDEAVEQAMKKDREHLGSRFIVLARETSSSKDHENGNSRNGSSSSSGRYTVRMGGLPFRASVDDIIDWFRPEADCVYARILRNRDNRPSGEAVAEFASEDEAKNAMTKNRAYMGDRFVVLTPQGF